VVRYWTILLPSNSISSSATRAHFMPLTVFAASATAFSGRLCEALFGCSHYINKFLSHLWFSFDCDRDLTADQPAVFIREAELPASGYSGVLRVNGRGNIPVEAKLTRNGEVLRNVLAQILEVYSLTTARTVNGLGRRIHGLDLVAHGRHLAKFCLMELFSNEFWKSLFQFL
jgi:hypothetical protein